MSAKPYTWQPGAVGDIYVLNVTASWFGGPNDPDDDGRTASGLNTRSNPGLLGCALPMAISNGAAVPGCKGSPLPTMPYLKTYVQVWRADRQLSVDYRGIIIPLIDCGPDLVEDRPIDLTPPAFVALEGDLEAGLLKVSFRIIDAARYISLGGAPVIGVQAGEAAEATAQTILTFGSKGESGVAGAPSSGTAAPAGKETA